MESGKKLGILVFLGKTTQIMETIMEVFKDNNDWNEKSIVGFIAFAIMCVIMIVDLVTGWLGRDLMINEFVYDSFVLVVLGCFGISGLEKFAKK
jgi:formate-dependent nitrite reductase membrane component NrfD